MQSFYSLVVVFMKQLIRSKALWIIIGILALMMLVNFYYQSQFKEMIEKGVSYDIATRETSSNLKALAGQIRQYAVFFVIIIAALIAPGSRRNGTTQFVLSMQVSRFRLALAQFSALSIFVLMATLLVHIGFCIAAIRVNYVGAFDFIFSWIFLFFPLLLTAAVSFTLSLAFSSIVVYLIIFALPMVLLKLLDNLIEWKADWIPVFTAHLVDNMTFLFPNPETIIFWPFFGPQVTISDPPLPVWHWSVFHFLFSACFWIALGYNFYRNYNIGSRRQLK